MKKKLFITVLFSALFVVAHAQKNLGIFNFGIGEYQTAKAYFEQQLSTAPAESNYYLGEIAFALDQMEDAKAFYDKGITADPTYNLNYIGKGKMLLKTDPKAAETLFASTLKKNKKNAEVNVAIARAYFECGMKDVALTKLAIAKKVAKKSPLPYILEGDMIQAEPSQQYQGDSKTGKVAGCYDQARYFDPEYAVASVKYAQVYESIDPNTSIEILKKVIADHPDYTIAYKYLGRSLNLNGNYMAAIDAFKTYTATGSLTVDDIIKFATSYYYTEQYPESIELINKGLQMEPANFVLNRFRMYNAAKTADMENGLTYADYFFTLKSERGTFISSDYTAYASILALNEQYDKALKLYEDAIQADPTKAELYKEIYTVYTSLKDYVKAGENYQKYIDLTDPSRLSAYDYFQLGRAYYFAGTIFNSDSTVMDKAKAKEYFIKADTTFNVICTMSPDSYLGHFWRGHTNASMETDPSQGLGKPYYEAAINAILKKNQETGVFNNKKDLINAYQYLGFYYYVIQDKVNSLKYWDLILELDPTNKNANLVKEEYSKKK